MLFAAAILCVAAVSVGCGTSYRTLRRDGQQAMLDQRYGAARNLLRQADEKKPRRIDNLNDLGTCSMVLARDKFEQRNYAAAMREIDAAILYYSQAIDIEPGHQASLEGKHQALKLKGQFDRALEHAEWVATFVGPSAKQFVFLAQELEERGDYDEAFLRYRQAVVVEPKNAEAHRAFAKFLLRVGNDDAAVHHLQTSYRLDPTNAWVTEQLVSRGAVPTLMGEPTSGS